MCTDLRKGSIINKGIGVCVSSGFLFHPIGLEIFNLSKKYSGVKPMKRKMYSTSGPGGEGEQSRNALLLWISPVGKPVDLL